MPRPQFSNRTLLWLTLVAAAFLGGMAVQRQITESKRSGSPRFYPNVGHGEIVVLQDGTSRFQSVVQSIEPGGD